MRFYSYFIILFVTLTWPVFPETGEETLLVLEKNEITGIFGDESDLWVSSNGNGIYNIKNNIVRNFSSSDSSISNDFVYSITGNKDFIWAGSADGLFILNRKTGKWQKRKFGQGGQLANWIRSVVFDPVGNCVWIGRFKFLTKYDLSTKRYSDYNLTRNGNEKANTIQTISLDGDSLLWVGTEAGLHKLYKNDNFENPGSSHFYDKRLNYFEGSGQTLSVSSVIPMKDNVWIALDEFLTPENPDYNKGGLYKFNRKNSWERFEAKDGLQSNGIYSLELTGRYLWISLYTFNPNQKTQYGRGLAIMDLISGKIRKIESIELPSKINKIYYDGKLLWLGTISGLYKVPMKNSFAEFYLEQKIENKKTASGRIKK